MSTLYRKYRPQSFTEVIGQNHIKITLQNELAMGQIGHAYLFCGPRGLGKTTVARLFAKSVNCENRKDNESEPCNKCPSCTGIMTSSSIDIIEIDAASHTGVDKVRENIIENVRFTPNKSKYKVFIIDEVHMLSTSAFNALLKTLEEPPSYVIFILCTTEIHKLPQTIISRCQRFDFRKVSAEDMLKRLEHLVKLEKKKVAEEVLKNIVVHSEGCVRDAESLLGKILTLGDKITAEQAELVLPRSDFRSIVSFTEFLLEKNSTGAIGLINQLIEDGVELIIFVENFLEFLRKLLLLKVNGNLGDFGIELDEESQVAAEKLASKFSYDQLIFIIELFMERSLDIKSSAIQQLPLELAVIEIIEGVSVKNNKDDNFSGPGGGTVAVGKSSENIIKQNEFPKKHIERKPVLSDVDVIKAPAEDIIKVNMISKSDKIIPKTFFDLNKVIEFWPSIVEALLEKNYTIASLLKISQPLRVKDNILEIGVRNNFYCGRLNDLKNKKMIEEVIGNILKAEVIVKGEVRDDLSPIEFEIKELPVPMAIPIEIKTTTATPLVPTIPPPASKDVLQEVASLF